MSQFQFHIGSEVTGRRVRGRGRAGTFIHPTAMRNNTMSERPYVTINCAMSADGKIALASRVQTSISSEEDFMRVHALRNESDAILVGIGTVLSDDPSLTVKEKFVSEPRHPLRVVLDTSGRIPRDAKALDGRAETLVAVGDDFRGEIPGAEVARCGSGRVDLRRLLDVLGERGVKRVMVEGGSEVIWSFLREGLADEYKVYVGSLVLGGRDAPTPAGGDGAGGLDGAVRLDLERSTRLGDGILLEYRVLR